MIMIDQSKRLSEPLRWGRRERAAVAAVLACLVLVLAGLGVYALTSGGPARRDCITLTFPSTLGGAEVHECGAKAKATCASPSAYPHLRPELHEACRRAGFPYS